ncbi:hypothetical protein GCE86_24740 [Micromonospora terminaliae]|uniref:DUF2637 domain-containing protein n=1 Tax=Micromonospora terminaliae TaxID=1914461 RepID=A0AAJ2ZJ66_9ACTN|nr:hypothetical protein [Micromonospora terminaliae]NES29879.1 hypothetical protein [Micromonospora terminaliae]QGL49944.1 hypothetical protein GCE86_24740 [Micromonospora terminaliae]
MRRFLNADGLEAVALVLILLVVAGTAGWASFSHVHDWTMRHVPDGTPDAFGWANAVLSDLVPVACLLDIRRRRRRQEPIGYPVFLMLAFACFSLAAQLAVADASPSGWLLSALPALAFMALTKLVFSGSSAPAPAPAPAPIKAPAPAPAREPVDVEPVDVPTAPAPVLTPSTPSPVPVPAPAVAPVRSALISSVVQTPRNGQVFASEVTR